VARGRHDELGPPGALFQEVRFAADSPLEGAGFEPSVPQPDTELGCARRPWRRSGPRESVGATFQLGAVFGVGRCGGIEKTSLISLTSEERLSVLSRRQA
jgi:hypothetical protein